MVTPTDSPVFTQYNNFHVHQLFFDHPTREQQTLKTKATRITNILLMQEKSRDLQAASDLKTAKELAYHHFNNLQNAQAQEMDHVCHMLTELQEKGINDFGLAEIAHCYGYQFSRLPADVSGPKFHLTRLHRL